jgi:hypothetical protein
LNLFRWTLIGGPRLLKSFSSIIKIMGSGRDISVIDIIYNLSQIILGKMVDSPGLPHLYIVESAGSEFIASRLAHKIAYEPSDCF